jgi:hypothetical protein
LKVCTLIFSFQYKEEDRADELDAWFLHDIRKKNSKKIGFEIMGYGKYDKAFKSVYNKELGYLAAAKYITCLFLRYAITFAQLWTLSSHPVKIEKYANYSSSF